ncbi:ABC transporter substrate-binding protein [Streptomyces sp. NBRC 110028]|uniref:ABC transporter substrate-binding protein n=1 Tax=Streptomyces sp. NBRC 110028 TaxID=1621260 RepID=UPI0006E36946|nr:ABC transporter substrate-binding protein [Streptomyces sp. NBRC 110028]
MLAVASMLLAGCADGGASSSSSDGSTIKVGLARTLTYMPGELAESLGYLKEEAKKVGSTVKIVPFDSSSQSLAALAAGQIDMDVQLAQNAARAQTKGQDLVITEVLNDVGVGGLVVSKDISSPKDLEGKTVAFTGKATAAYPLLLAALKRDGVNTSKVHFLTISDQSAFQQTLSSGQVDAILPGEPVISQAVAAGDGKLMYNFFNRDLVNTIMGGRYASVTLMANGGYLKKNPDQVRAVTRAFERTMIWMKENKNHPDTVLAKLPRDYSDLKPIFPQIFGRVEQALPENPAVNAAALKRILKIDQEQGAIDPGQKVDIAKLYNNSFLR